MRPKLFQSCVCLLEDRIGTQGILGLGLPTGGQSQVLGSMTAGTLGLRAGIGLFVGGAGFCYDRLWGCSDLGSGVHLSSVEPWLKCSWGWYLPTHE